VVIGEHLHDQPVAVGIHDEAGQAVALAVDEAECLGLLGQAEDLLADAEYRATVGAVIREFGATLKDKDKVIFDARLMAEEPLTLQEIGDRYHISRERVRQIEERIKKKLKNYLLAESPDLKDAVVDIIR
jgi:RNA polymerase sigma factor (sigma-70 family)